MRLVLELGCLGIQMFKVRNFIVEPYYLKFKSFFSISVNLLISRKTRKAVKPEGCRPKKPYQTGRNPERPHVSCYTDSVILLICF